MWHLIKVTTFFPNSADPHRAVFVSNLVHALRQFCAISVISPIVYAPPFRGIRKWRNLRNIATKEIIDDCEVLHPRFIVIPKLVWLTGVSYGVGILPAIFRIKRAFRDCILHAHFGYPDGVGVALAARFFRLPYIITVHGSDINVYSNYRTLWPQMKWALSNAAYVIVVSRDLGRKIRIRSNGAVKRLHCVPCAGFDPAVFFPRDKTLARTKLNQSERSKIILFVGRLVVIKGIEFLIEAWNKLLAEGRLSKTDKLVVIGDGDDSPRLRARASLLGLDESIRFVGELKQAEIAEWLAAADLLCLPSLNEGTPNVVIEAMASGRPVVATRVGGLPEIVDDEVNGLLVSPSNVTALADALKFALSRNWPADVINATVAHLTWTVIAQENKRLLDEYFTEKNSVLVG